MQPLHSAQVIFYLTSIIVFLVTVGAAAWRFNNFSGGAREPAREGKMPWKWAGRAFQVGLKLVEVGKFQEKQGKFLKSQIP